MAESPEPTPTKKSRPRRRRLLAAVAGLVAVALLAVLVAFLVIRTGRLDRYVEGQVKAALAEYGVRAEFGRFELGLNERTATVDAVALYNQENGRLLATADHAVITVETPGMFAPSLHRDVIFKRADLTNLQVYVDVDENGVSNLAGLHVAAPAAPRRIAFDFSTLVASIQGGTLHLDDRAHAVTGELGGLSASGEPLPGGELVGARITAGPGRVSYQGRETTIDALEVSGRAGQAGAEIDALTLRSPAAEATLTGRVDDWSAPKPDLAVQARVALGEAGRVTVPDAGLRGSATFDGRLTGDGRRFRVAGALAADELVATEGGASGVRADEVAVEVGGDRPVEFSIAHVTADSASARGARLGGLVARQLAGDLVDGTMRFRAADLRAASVVAQGARLAGVAIADVAGDLTEGRTTVRAARVAVRSVAARPARLAGVTLRNAAADVVGGRYAVTGDLAIGSGAASGARLGPTRGRLSASDTEIALTNFQSSVLGGRASGDVRIRTAGGGPSRLSATFSGVRTDELFAVAGAGKAPVAGTVNGSTAVTWPGTNVGAVSGTIAASFEGQTAQTTTAIPVTGTLSARARGGVFDVDRLLLETGASRLEASGRVSRRGDTNLDVTVTSSRAEELQTLAESFDGVRDALASYQPTVAGTFDFRGTVSGAVADPSVAGDLSVGSVGVGGQTLGSLTGHVVVAPDRVAFERGVLAATNGGRATVDYSAPRAELATNGRLDATLDHIDAGVLAAAVGLGADQTLVRGTLSGDAHLTGIPAAPTGTADMRLVDGSVAGQPAQTATARLVFDGRTARIERAELHLPQGLLTASGELDMKGGAFRVEGRATDVDLGALATSSGLTAAAVVGTANATFTATGNTNDASALNIEGTAEGRGVAVNGRDLGPITLTARTNASGRLDVDLTTGFTGRPEPLRATVDLRKPGRPIVLDSTFTDVDLRPLLAALAPDAAASVSGSVTGTLHVGGPLVGADGRYSLAALDGELTLTGIRLQLGATPIMIQTPVRATLAASRVALAATRITGPGIDLRLGGALGLGSASSLAFSLAGSVDLSEAVPPSADLVVGGTVTVDARLSGTAADPRLAGEVRASDLVVTGMELPVALAQGTGRVVLSGDRVTLESFDALANDGTVKASGSARLAGLRPAEWRFVAEVRDVDVYYRGADVTLGGDLTLQGTPDHQVLSGLVTVPVGEYTTDFDLQSLTEAGASGGAFSLGSLGAAAAPGMSWLPPMGLDLRVSAPGTLLVRNQQVNTVASANLTIGGTVDEPNITGRVAVEGGTIKFRSERYDIVTGTIDFTGGGAAPIANFVAEGDVSGYHVTVGLQGPTDALEVNLAADPTLSRAEILSLVATGRTDLNTLGSQELVASGLGAAGSILSREFISEPAQQTLGLNRFSIDPVLQPNANPAARLTVGTQLTRDLSFTYSTSVGSEQDQSAIVEYTVSNRLSAVASYTQGGTMATGQRIDSDFTLEVRGRKRYSLGYVHDAPTIGPGLRVAARALPEADVSVNLPPDLDLSGRRLRELVPVESQGFSRALARLGERNLTNYLQEKGYFFARVASRCEPANCSGPDLRLVYDVKPGDRFELTHIRVEGVEGVEDSDDLLHGLESKEQSPFAKLPLVGGYARGLTSDDRIRRDRDTIRARMADLGYRSAGVRARLERDPNGKDIALIFAVEPGPRSTIADVRFSGNTVLASDDLRAATSVETGQHFSPTAARDAVRRVKELYGDRGFLDATAQYHLVDVAEDRVGLVFEVTEGARSRVAEIAVTGHTHTNESSIRRFVAFAPGDVLTPTAIRRTQRDLYATGAFSEVAITDEPIDVADPGARRVTVRVTEARPLLLVYGLGYSTDDGPRGLVQLSNNNLFGRVNAASMRLRVSPREQLAQVQYVDLRPFGTAWATTISAFYDRNSNLQSRVQRDLVGGGTTTDTGPSYGTERFVAFAQLERKLSEIMSLRFRYSYEDTSLFNAENIPLVELGRNDRSIHLGLVSAGFTRDTRDSALDPTVGQLISMDHSLAARPLGGSEAFNKFFLDYQWYDTLSDSTPALGGSVLAFSARLGLAANYAIRGTGANGRVRPSDRLLPISERFFAGGATTLRGFGFEEAGPQGVLEPRNDQELPTLIPIGGDALTIFNFELRYPLSERFRLVPFYDLGNVFKRVRDISVGGMTNTLGVGLRYKTPLGPIGFDVGFLLDPPSFRSATGMVLRQPRYAIHIRFGQSF